MMMALTGYEILRESKVKMLPPDAPSDHGTQELQDLTKEYLKECFGFDLDVYNEIKEAENKKLK